jgi:hypothetical protein
MYMLYSSICVKGSVTFDSRAGPDESDGELVLLSIIYKIETCSRQTGLQVRILPLTRVIATPTCAECRVVETNDTGLKFLTGSFA